MQVQSFTFSEFNLWFINSIISSSVYFLALAATCGPEKEAKMAIDIVIIMLRLGHSNFIYLFNRPNRHILDSQLKGCFCIDCILG